MKVQSFLSPPLSDAQFELQQVVFTTPTRLKCKLVEFQAADQLISCVVKRWQNSPDKVASECCLMFCVPFLIIVLHCPFIDETCHQQAVEKLVSTMDLLLKKTQTPFTSDATKATGSPPTSVGVSLRVGMVTGTDFLDNA